MNRNGHLFSFQQSIVVKRVSKEKKSHQLFRGLSKNSNDQTAGGSGAFEKGELGLRAALLSVDQPTPVRTQPERLDRYWRHRIIGADASGEAQGRRQSQFSWTVRHKCLTLGIARIHDEAHYYGKRPSNAQAGAAEASGRRPRGES